MPRKIKVCYVRSEGRFYSIDPALAARGIVVRAPWDRVGGVMCESCGREFVREVYEPEAWHTATATAHLREGYVQCNHCKHTMPIECFMEVPGPGY